jgi:CarD family transcriptional regulator
MHSYPSVSFYAILPLIVSISISESAFLVGPEKRYNIFILQNITVKMPVFLDQKHTKGPTNFANSHTARGGLSSFQELNVFSPDQLVVYPAQGVGFVESVTPKEIGGCTEDFYIVKILGSNITLMVPVKTAHNVGLRHLSTRRECESAFNGLRDKSTFTGYTGQNWNRRYREYLEYLQNGTLDGASHVLKELLLISAEKDLSFGERRLLEQAMHLVSMEIACVLGCKQADIQARIKKLFSDILETEETNV